MTWTCIPITFDDFLGLVENTHVEMFIRKGFLYTLLKLPTMITIYHKAKRFCWEAWKKNLKQLPLRGWSNRWHWRVVLFKTSISCFLLLLSERERQWKENNDFLKSQISKLRQQSADFKKDVLTRSNASSTFAEQASLRTFALTVSVHPGHVELLGPICQN